MRRTKRNRAPGNPMPLGFLERFIGGLVDETISWVRPADVRADRTGKTMWVPRMVSEEVVLPQRHIVVVRGQYQRRAAGPAAEALRGHLDDLSALCLGAPGLLAHIAPESGDILFQFPVDDVAAVSSQVVECGPLSRRHRGQDVIRIVFLAH